VNPDGTGDQENGDGVYFKTRPYRYIVAVVHPRWEILDKPEPKTVVGSGSVSKAS
jgi:hypothetical protein